MPVSISRKSFRHLATVDELSIISSSSQETTPSSSQETTPSSDNDNIDNQLISLPNYATSTSTSTITTNNNDNNNEKWKLLRGGQVATKQLEIISLVMPSELVYLKKSTPRDEEGVLIAAILNLFQNNKNITHHLNDIKTIIKSKVQTAKVKGVLLTSSIKSSVGLKSLIKVKYLAINSTEVARRGITPILVFVNHKSGGQYGKKLIQGLRKILHYTQICDLSIHAPSYYLNLYKDVPLRCILCCGGDGTVGWIMDEKKHYQLHSKTPVGVIPLGTGNDLHNQLMSDLFENNNNDNDNKRSKALKRILSSTMDPSFFSANPTTVLSLYSPQGSCKTSTLDRWAIAIGPLLNDSINNNNNSNKNNTTTIDGSRIESKNKIGKALSQLGSSARTLLEKGKRRANRIKKLKTMNNYFGIGIDGAVSIAFDHMRHKLPGLFFHKLMNKLWYALIGIRTFLFGRNKDLSKTTKITCDGKNVVIPSGVKGILVVNINSYAGGTNLWTMPKPWEQQKMNDGVVEVVAFNGLAHLGQIKTGLAKAIPLCQGKKLEIISSDRVPMQLDGEPFYQNPCKIDICLSHQVQVLQPSISSCF